MPALSDVAWIYVILTGLYVFESLAWVSSGAVAIRSYFGRFRCPTRTHRLLGNDAGYLPTFGVAPVDATLIVEACPISVAPEGIYGYVATSLVGVDAGVDSGPASWLYCPWDRIGEVKVVDRELRLEGKMLCRLSTTETARSLAGTLADIAGQPEQDREAAISRFVTSQFDTQSIQSRVDAWRAATRRLRFVSLMLFFWIFPVGIARYQGWLPGFSDVETIAVYLVIVLSLWWLCVGLLFFGHRRLYPGDRLQRWKLFLTSLVSPAAAMRSSDHLARRLIGISHPVALAAVVCGDEEVCRWAGRLARDMSFPKPPQGVPAESQYVTDELAQRIVREYRQQSYQALAMFSQERGFDLEPFLVPPTREDPHTVSYCPRCHQEFSVAGSRCGQCGDLATVEYH
ncbi:MAG TPA: hypothetical protein DDZ51_23120 [Planctomycetaceae bacterium]|nr:hypothetical protein [Planctomycetaceae bacterium]